MPHSGFYSFVPRPVTGECHPVRGGGSNTVQDGQSNLVSLLETSA